MKTVFALLGFLIFLASPALTQERAEAEFRVSGLCGMCKSRIERSLKIKDVKKAVWDRETKVLTVVYNPASMSADSLQKLVAAVGHDTEKFAAPDSVYAELPGCCQYRASESGH